eukprot:tig00021489_g21657.t1
MAGAKVKDFQVRVHVIECRITPTQAVTTAFAPVCFVKALGKSQNTKIVNNTMTAIYDQLMIFEGKVSDADFINEQVSIELRNGNAGFRRFAAVGTSTFPLKDVYVQPGHEFFRKWVGIIDGQGNVQGYLRVTIQVLGPGDEPVTHSGDADEGEASADGKSLSPSFNTELALPVTLPSLSDLIRVEVWDYNTGGNDELIGLQEFKLSEIRTRKFGPQWVNLYAATAKGGQPSVYRGRVLMEILVEKLQGPGKPETRNISPLAEPPLNRYFLRMDLMEAAEFPQTALTDLVVEVSCGHEKRSSASASLKNGVATFFESLQDLSMMLPVDIRAVPDVIISVYAKQAIAFKNRLGYIRIPADKLVGKKEPPAWRIMTTDTLGSVETFPGFLFFQCQLNTAERMDLARSILPKPKYRPYEIRAHIFQGRQLPAADDNGASDPYCVVRINGKEGRTKRKDVTTDPNWYETVILKDVLLPEDLRFAQEIQCLVYDFDRLGSDEYLGRATFPVAPLQATLQKPSWAPIYFDDPAVKEGRILVSFQLIPASQASMIPLQSIVPPSSPMVCEILALGCRSLQTSSLLPPQEPYIEFDAGERDRATEKVKQTRPSNLPTAKSPNYLEVIRVPVDVPQDPIFAPSISFRVYDRQLAGISTPLIGVGSVDLEKIINPPVAAKLTALVARSAQVASNFGASVSSFMSGLGFGGQGAPDAPIAVGMRASLLEGARSDDPSHAAASGRPSLAGLLPGGAGVQAFGTGMGAGETMFSRPTLDGELEEIMEGAKPFESYPLTTGNMRKMRLEGKTITKDDMVVGYFKARRTPPPLRASVPPLAGAPGRIKVVHFQDAAAMLRAENDKNKLFTPQEVVVRVYVLRGLDLTPKDDLNNLSDPYLILELGKHKVDEKAKHIPETLQPDFYRYFEFQTTLPGAGDLKISVMDYDRLKSDDLIGETTIDLENRWYSEEWKQMPAKPLEVRSLWSPSSATAQGKLECWVDIMTPEVAKRTPPVKIEKPPPARFELRVAVWEVTDVPVRDDLNGANISIAAELPGAEGAAGQPQKTDVHHRCFDGRASFNYRLKWTVELPYKGQPRLAFRLRDQPVSEKQPQTLQPPQTLGEAVLSLRNLFQQAQKDPNGATLEKQTIPLTIYNSNGRSQAKLVVSLSVLSEMEAGLRRAGFGQEEPNNHPFLPPPNREAPALTRMLGPAATKFTKDNRTQIIVLVAIFVLALILFAVLAAVIKL